MVGSFVAPKWPIMVPFCGMDLTPFLLEAVEASRCYFLENWLMKHKWATLVIMQSEIQHQKSQYFYPSEPFILDHSDMRHPVVRYFRFWWLEIEMIPFIHFYLLEKALGWSRGTLWLNFMREYSLPIQIKVFGPKKFESHAGVKKIIF